MSAAQLRAARLSLGMTQVEFGLQLGYRHPQVRVAELEAGRAVISRRTRLLVMHLLRSGPIELDDLDLGE